MRVLVCGGRDYDDFTLVNSVLVDVYIENKMSKMTIIQGGAKGADFLSRAWANWKRDAGADIDWVEYPADWKTHGKAAGYIRNKQMLDEGKPDLVVAFPGGRGTADMIRQAKAAGVEVMEVKDD
jgi:UDP-N-acetylmuramoylalanine-D-glutamate ligase